MTFSQIKAFFFDLDGTLRLPNPSPVDAFFEVARTMGIYTNTEKMREVKLWAYEFWGNDRKIKADMDSLGGQQFWINYSGLLLNAVDPAENSLERATYITNWFQTAYNPTVTVEPSSYQTLMQLKEKGYYVGLISNRAEPLYEAVDELGLNDLFDFTLAAGEIGYWKPNPNIFWHALSFFPSLVPENCIYVGDNYFADAVGARTAGLQPVVFDPDLIYDFEDVMRVQTIAELLPLAAGKIPI